MYLIPPEGKIVLNLLNRLIESVMVFFANTHPFPLLLANGVCVIMFVTIVAKQRLGHPFAFIHF